MKRISPYIGFDGKTREAIEFYKGIFGGDATYMKWSDTPVPCETGKEDWIMHAQLEFDGFAVMGTDMSGPEGRKVGNNMSISIECSSEEEINRLFAGLSEGGNVFCPVGPAFWGGTFGMTFDKYGVPWVFTHSEG